MSINYFARYIGLPRGENLYQIRRGHNGISKDVARRIVTRFPEISELWLLTGSGQMFVEEDLRGAQFPLYRVDVERFISRVDTLPVDGQVVFPMVGDCDLAMLYMSEAMSPLIPVGTVVFLKEIGAGEIIPGSEYVISSGNLVLLRRVRATDDAETWRLVACDRERFDDLTIRKAEVGRVWKVCGRLTLNN